MLWMRLYTNGNAYLVNNEGDFFFCSASECQKHKVVQHHLVFLFFIKCHLTSGSDFAGKPLGYECQKTS